jgi:hypothetical protein
MSGDIWVRIDIYKPRGALDQQTHDKMKKTITALVNGLEKAGQPGFQIGYWGRNSRDGTMAAVTYWSDRASIEGAAGRLRRLYAEAHALGMTQVDSRNVHLYSLSR